MKKLVLSFVVMMVLGISGCETMKGLGEDISKAGQAIKKSASE